MEPAARMFISSSYWSDNIGLVAALTTIRELKRRDAQNHFQRIGEGLKSALSRSFAEAGLGGRCAGVYANPYLKATLAHSEDDIAQTAAAATEAFRIIRQGLEQDQLDALIVADLKKDPFRRLVK